MKEAVNHPSHYGGDTVYEVIKVVEAWELDFHDGNTVKYIARAGKKDPQKMLEDYKKALWYLQRKINILKKNEIEKEAEFEVERMEYDFQEEPLESGKSHECCSGFKGDPTKCGLGDG